MAKDSFKVKKSLNIKPTDPATVSNPEAGDLIVDSTANNSLKAYNADAGIFEEVSSGNGGLSVFDTLNFESAQLGDFATGNNAAFLGGGSLVGTAAFETVAPLSKLKSFKFTQAVGSAADYVAFGVVDLEKRVQGQLVGVEGIFTYTGNSNEVDFIVYDVTNSNILGSVPIRKSTNALSHQVLVNVPSNCTQIRYGIQIVTENDGAVLLVDNIEAKVNPLTPTDIYASSEWNDGGTLEVSATTTAPSKGNSPTTDRVRWRRDGQDAIIRYEYRQSTTTGATAGSGDYLFKLPSGLKADTTEVTAYPTAEGSGTWLADNSLGHWSGWLGTNNAQGSVVLYDEDYVRLAGFTDTGEGYIGSGYGPLNGVNTYTIVATFRIPIAGWSDTAQGVVVKNRTDSASVENVFSARIDNNGTATVTSESVDWIESVNRTAAGFVDVTFKAGLFSVAPKVTITSESSGSFNNSISSLTTSGVTVVNRNVEAATFVDGDFTIDVQRQGTDYIKETDKVYTVDVSSLRGNWVRAEGNGGTSITANVTDVDFTEVTDTASAWDGDSYTVQKNNSVIKISAGFYATSSANRFFSIYKNGSLYKILSDVQNDTAHKGDFTSSRGEFISGDVITIRSSGSFTLSNDSTYHYLNITEEYGKEGVYLGTFGQPTCYVKDVKASGTEGGTASAGTWNDRDLNTVEGSCSFLSLSSNDFTLSSGSYNIDCSAPSLATDRHKLKLRIDADTAPSDYLFGTSEYADTTVATQSRSFLNGNISISSSKVFDLQHYTQVAKTGNGLGEDNAPSGVNEIYAQCKITKVR